MNGIPSLLHWDIYKRLHSGPKYDSLIKSETFGSMRMEQLYLHNYNQSRTFPIIV